MINSIAEQEAQTTNDETKMKPKPQVKVAEKK
jgi:hypothetical protein